MSFPSSWSLALSRLISTMIRKNVELHERGLKDFASLTPLERDYFAIKDLDI